MGIIGLNVLIVIAAGILGAYFVRAKLLEHKYALPLSLTAALYGGCSLTISIAAVGVRVYERYMPSAI